MSALSLIILAADKNYQAEEEAQITAIEMGGGDGLFECSTCSRQYKCGRTMQYAPECPYHGKPEFNDKAYDPVDRILQGANSPEKVFCQHWQPDRFWFYAPHTGQRTRDKVPTHLKP